MSDDKPFERRCTNPGFENRFTCPGCYEDHLGAPASIKRCTKCNRALTCRIEMQPVAVCELAIEDEEALCDDCELPIDICACEETEGAA